MRTYCEPSQASHQGSQLPSHFQEEERTWISGTTIYRDQLVLILSPEWVLGELGEVVTNGVSPQALSIS